MRYKHDPYWLIARYPGRCTNGSCQGHIHPGSKAFYYPKGKFILCAKCGEAASREFDMLAMDEEMYA